MLDLKKIRRRAEEFRREARRGYRSVPMKIAVAHLVTPLIRLIEAMESGTADRWLTLEEVIVRTGWSRKYYDKRLASLGGLSRLEQWEANGKAVKAPPGIWLIHPAQVPPPKPGYEPPIGNAVPDSMRPAPRAPQQRDALSVESIVDDLVA